ncbi:MAG: ABC transporter permease [Clostridia bacterium]|nr:ABC transporter permease [Clostridia bacterium]MBR5742450.1 ABC transporter permease [Clostridia bacterium]
MQNKKIRPLLGERGANAALLAPMYLFTVVFLIGPFVYMIVLSFLSRAETWGVVNEFTLRNYLKIFEPTYLSTFWESIKLALLTTALVILTGYPFGYFMAKLPPRLRGLMLMLVTIPFWTSSLMRLYGWIIIFRANGLLDKLLMALRLTGEPLKLLYTYPAVVVGMVYALAPFMILSVYSSVEKMDWTLVEAARDLGAGPVRAFLTVTLKATMPGLMTGVILTFVPSMALFFIADILGGNKIALIGNVIQDQLMKVHDWPFAAALAVVLMLMTTLMIFLYRIITGSKDMEGII